MKFALLLVYCLLTVPPTAVPKYRPSGTPDHLVIKMSPIRLFRTFPISAERAFPSQRTFETYRFLVHRAVSTLQILVGDGNAAVSRLVTGDNDALGIGEVTDA